MEVAAKPERRDFERVAVTQGHVHCGHRHPRKLHTCALRTRSLPEPSRSMWDPRSIQWHVLLIVNKTIKNILVVIQQGSGVHGGTCVDPQTC